MKKLYLIANRRVWKNPVLGKQYIRYLLSYVAVLMIPMVVLTFFYSSRFMKKFYGEIYETVDLELMQIGDQLENEWSAMENIVGQITLTGRVDQAADAGSALELSSVISYLSNFSCANPFIKDIALILNDQSYIVTGSTTCKKDYYFQHIVQFSHMDPQTLTNALEQLTAPACFPSQDILHLGLGAAPEEMALFAFPLFTDYQKRAGTALFFVSGVSLEKMINQKFQSYQAQIYILDSQGNQIAASGPSPDVIEQEPGQYIVRSYQSPKTLWTYLAFLPDRATTFSQVSDILKEFILAIVITLLLSGLAISFLQRINYAPVRKLKEKAGQLSPGTNSSDELATISSALDFLSVENDSLSNRLKSSMNAVKDQRLYRLLSGSYVSCEDFNLDCSELDLSLPYEYYSVAIIMLHVPIPDLNALAEELVGAFPPPSVCYSFCNFHPDQIVFLSNIEKPSDQTDSLFLKLQDYLLKNHGLMATMGIGSVSNATDLIPQSYMEAASALDYRFVKGNGTIIRFQEVSGSTQTPVCYPHQEFEALYNALLSRSEQNIPLAIDNIILFMQKKQIPLYLARSICFDLIHMVNNHYQGTRTGFPESPLALSGMETAQEIIRMLQDWSREFSAHSFQAAEKAGIEEILAYLDQNCLRCDFSAYETAEYFHMTLPAFSKYFKDSTGQNVMDYSINMRIQKAKKLLSSTNLPLKDISEQVGYYNVSSFTRRFKLNQGVTPSEYRKITGNSTVSCH